jgi:polysaccharide export outer membrane protein
MTKIFSFFALFLSLITLDACAVQTEVPATPAAEAPYTIIAGDVLQITVWKEDGLDRETVVLPGGSISFPLIGSVDVQGKTIEEVQAIIKKKLHKYITDASVSVTVKADLGHTVSVIGQVAKPGEFVMGHHLTVMQALSQAGGLTPYAKDGSIIVLRREEGKEISVPVPYDDIEKGDNLDEDIILKPGDVVVVPTVSLF